MTYTLTATVDLRYRLREMPHSKKCDDGFILKAGDSIHITEDALGFFYARALNGAGRTKGFTVTPR